MELSLGPLFIRGISSLAILVIGWLLSGFAAGLVNKMLVRARVEVSIAGFGSMICSYALKALVLIAVLAEMGIDTTSLAAIVGATGLAIGLALRNTLSNVAAGILLVTLRPFKVGDLIEASGKLGKVAEINLFHTQIKLPDNCEATIPNGNIFNGTVTNFSRSKARRWECSLRIPYDQDRQIARSAIFKALDKHPLALKDPAPIVLVSDVGDNAITLMVRVWLPTQEFAAGRYSVLEEIYSQLQEKGISIAKNYCLPSSNSR